MALEGILQKFFEAVSCRLGRRPQSREGDEIGWRPPPKTHLESLKFLDFQNQNKISEQLTNRKLPFFDLKKFF